MKTFEIYWSDLTEQAQEKLKEMYHKNTNIV